MSEFKPGTIPTVDITQYSGAGGFLKRPVYLYNDVFYQPADIPQSDELNVLAQEAVASLVGDGYETQEAEEYVALRIHAAAAFGATASSQQELQANVTETPSSQLSNNDDRNDINPIEAIDIAPFLTATTTFEFSLDDWLENATQIPEDWEVTRASLRWLSLWQNRASAAAVSSLLRQSIEIEGINGIDELALYAGKLTTALADRPDVLDELLSNIDKDQSLALFGELGPDSDHIKRMEHEIGAEAVSLQNVRQVRHVDHFAGSCPKMDWRHESTLFGEDDTDDYEGDATLVSVDGSLVGSIEMTGRNSMMALKNVKNTAGNLVLVAGGVYVPRQSVVDKAKATFAADGKWSHITLDELSVRPLRFAGAANEWDDEYFKKTIQNIEDIYPQLLAKVRTS